MKGEHSENVSTDVDSYSIRQPLGVVAGITPFNFPAMVPMWMYPDRHRLRQHVRAQAVREGPVGGQLLRQLLAEAGLPDGVFNVVHGDKVAVDASSTTRTSRR
jgi:malonate-semialdehyde dehydrogenase (acetylating)/methylmalonate-semialdehyde dehydrogenase